MKRFCTSVVVLAVLVVAVAVAKVGCCEELAKQSFGSISSHCKQANATAEDRFDRTTNLWREKFAGLRSSARLQRMASEVASIDEKLAQGFELFASPGERTDRMRQSFRKHVVDERTLVRSMAESFFKVQNELIQETIQLLQKAGISPGVGGNVVKPVEVRSSTWERGFDATISKAKSLSQEDWFRFGMVSFGSDLIADAMVDAGKQAGLWQPEEGGWESILGGFVAQLAVEAVVENATDPTATFASQLQLTLVDAEKQILDGPSGLVTEMRRITTDHQNARLKFVGGTKGAK